MALRPACPRTGKRAYPTRGAALAAIVRGTYAGATLRPYRCEFCRRWHLTSQPKREETTDPCSARRSS